VTADPERFEEAIAAFHRRLPLTRAAWDELTVQEREFAFTVSNVAQADVVFDVWEQIETALKNGTGLDEFKAAAERSLTESWGVENAPRVETIFRTNVQTAYNAGRYEVFSAPAVKEARPYFRFDAIDDDRADDECLDLNGTVLPQDDSFWDSNHPPLHFNCRCNVTAISKEEAGDDGDDEAPETDHADEGFGERPGRDGEDWAPDLEKYPDEIADVLREKLE
jgi:SPP1 gp7 family putative phage head morphogenesis protein